MSNDHTAITHIDWRDDGATVTVSTPERRGIGDDRLAGFIEDIHFIRHQTVAMTAEQLDRLGPEVILLLRDVAPHLLRTPMPDQS